LSTGTLSVTDIIDRRPIGALQWSVFFLCGLAVFVEGFDTQAIGYVAPVLSKAWKLPPGALGPVFAAGLAGLALGAFFLAPLADKVGRKPLIVWSTVAFGVLTLATGFCQDFTTLLIARLATGIGLGAAMPNAITLTAEYSPQRRRATSVALLMCGFGLGAAAGGAAAAWLLAVSGWSSVFFAGGAVTLLLVPLLIFFLPESARFLTLLPDQATRLSRLMARIDPAIGPAARFAVAKEKAAAVHVRELFAHGQGRVTILLWIVFFMNLLDLYLLANWLPTAIHDAGLSVSVAALATATLQIGGIIASFALGPLVDRFGATIVLPVIYVFGAICIALIGFAGTSVTFTVAAVFGAGFAVVGSQNCNNGVAAKLYRTEIRATGVGWVSAVGRIGSIVGPTIAGVMLSLHTDIRNILFASAVPALIAAAAYLAMRSVGAGAADMQAAGDRTAAR
jgi:AAHS family 4-hydroxybenzoate transporter-like MFS transporter